MTSQETSIDKIFKKLGNSNSMSKEARIHLKPVETRPGMLYCFSKLH